MNIVICPECKGRNIYTEHECVASVKVNSKRFVVRYGEVLREYVPGQLCCYKCGHKWVNNEVPR